MFAGDAANLSRSAESVWLATGPLGMAPLAAVEALTDGVASLGIMVSPFAPQTSFRAERYRVKWTQ